MALAKAEVIAAIHPALLARAKELDPVTGEDLLQDAYVRFLERPPRARSAVKIKHWLRTVMLNMHIDRRSSGPD